MINSPQPGRSCPLHYRYAPADFARAADFSAQTLYVIGGLYGNVPALEAIHALAARETTPVTCVFNGDFNWFNVDDAAFQAINSEVLRHHANHAIRGNVETELADDDESAGCGCAYPDYVSEDDVARSNRIIVRLRETARRHALLRERLGALPMNRVADVGGVRVAIVHGDLESLAGWSLAEDFLAQAVVKETVLKQMLKARCQVIASSHTCLPVALTLGSPDSLESSNAAAGSGAINAAIFNNGAAGMPNFRGAPFGVITRIATTPAALGASLYGTRIESSAGSVYADALPVHYDHARWQREFLANWPPGSAAHKSYFQRITHGPNYAIARANRLSDFTANSNSPSVSNNAVARPTAVV